MTLDISMHRTIFFQILKDIYSDSTIAPYLGFKGGTSALMFYGLDRFSVALDFDLLNDEKEEEVFKKIIEIVKKYGDLKDSYIKRFTLFCLLSYGEKSHNIKIEIRRKESGSKYEIKNYLGVPILVMAKDDMFANKLVAMYERIGKTSRDVYDVWFFLNKRFPINKDLVESRSGMLFNDFIDACVKRLENLPDKKILDGLGELLTVGQKDWVRAKLKKETISLLGLRKV